jgi:hypothetical protein
VAGEDCTDLTFAQHLEAYGITLEGKWSNENIRTVLQALGRIGYVLMAINGEKNEQAAFSKVYGKTTITWNDQAGDGCGAGANSFSCNRDTILTAKLVAHELGHVFSWEYGGNPYTDLGNAALQDDEGKWITGKHTEPGGVFERTELGYKSGGPPDMYHGPDDWEDDWDSNENNVARNEDYADMFMNWVFDSFDYSGASGAGQYRYDWMTTNVAEYVR